MTAPKVSVIIPIYNVEPYLRKCIDSVRLQTLEDIEIFLASDGPEACHMICDEYAKIDARITVVKNLRGYGASVNHCIKLAKGEYVGIVESDDWIDPSMYQTLYDAAKRDDSDIAKAGFVFAYDDPSKNNLSQICTEDVTCTLKERPEILLFRQTIWSAIYRRQFLLQNSIYLYAKERLSYIDAPFQAKAFLKANKFSLISKPLYFYYQDNPGQSMQNIIKFAIDGVKVKEYMLTDCPPASIIDERVRQAYVYHICRDLYNDYRRYNVDSEKNLFWKNAHELLISKQGRELIANGEFFSGEQKNFIRCLSKYNNKEKYELLFRSAIVKYYLFSRVHFCTKIMKDGNSIYKILGISAMKICHSENKVYYKLFGLLPILKVRSIFNS